MKKNDDFKRFDALVGELLKVPHSEIKAKLEAEKKEKKRKPKAPASRDKFGGGT
jgi:hypothetical protein